VYQFLCISVAGFLCFDGIIRNDFLESKTKVQKGTNHIISYVDQSTLACELGAHQFVLLPNWAGVLLGIYARAWMLSPSLHGWLSTHLVLSIDTYQEEEDSVEKLSANGQCPSCSEDAQFKSDRPSMMGGLENISTIFFHFSQLGIY
jgi:hypothetical protein